MVCAYNRSMDFFSSALPESENNLVVFEHPPFLIMEQINPTQFKHVNAGEMPNAEQLLCGKTLDTIIALGIFEDYLFIELDSCPTNHLLKWCVEVLTAYEFIFFKKDQDESRNKLIDQLKMRFNVDLIVASNRTYEMKYELKANYDSFFNETLEEEKRGVLERMATYRKSISLPNFIREINEINASSVES